MDEIEDQPEDDGMTLVMPFVVCQSKGGPYDDMSFCAGWQAGEIDQALKTAAINSAQSVRYPIVHAGLLPQLELVGMHRGYPTMRVEHTAEGWADVTFERGEES